MADEPTDDARLRGEALIEALSAEFKAAAQQTQGARTHGPRQPERRTRERRGSGSSARRRDDVDWSQRARMLVLDYLHQLPDDHLWRWIDGLLVGRASAAHLAILVDSVRTDAPWQAALAVAQTPRHGRPAQPSIIAGVPAIENASLRYEWRVLRKQFKELAAARRQHHASSNRTRSGARRSVAYRETCLRSPIGQRVDQAALFSEFFDETHLVPGQMAAQLLHYEIAQRVRASEEHARAQAASALSDDDRAWYEQRATADTQILNTLPSWQTLYRKLHRQPPSKP